MRLLLDGQILKANSTYNQVEKMTCKKEFFNPLYLVECEFKSGSSKWNENGILNLNRLSPQVCQNVTLLSFLILKLPAFLNLQGK